MPDRRSNPDDTRLTFFSRVSAAVSHEIKNVLAIINENAGLLEDLVLMSEKGSPLSPERLRRLAKTVHIQIKRADIIVKNMNRFAHSADRPVDVVDLYDATVFITGLCTRMLRSKDLVVTVVPPDSPVTIETNRFCLQELIFVCIETIVSDADYVGTIQVAFQKKDLGAEIRFGCEIPLQSLSAANPVSAEVYSLMNYLKAEPVDGTGTDSFRLQLPESIRASSEDQ